MQERLGFSDTFMEFTTACENTSCVPVSDVPPAICCARVMLHSIWVRADYLTSKVRWVLAASKSCSNVWQLRRLHACVQDDRNKARINGSPWLYRACVHDEAVHDEAVDDAYGAAYLELPSRKARSMLPDH